jgi:hypothetical protein
MRNRIVGLASAAVWLVAIIGLHLIHLAWIFDVPRYYALGLHLCAIAAVTLLWYVFPSLGVVWAIAWGNLREASRELARVRVAQ